MKSKNKTFLGLGSRDSSPIIVLGMHRSGTTMIVGVLESLGVFMGDDKEQNLESRFFIGLNDWMLTQGSSTWDRPLDLKHLFDDVRMRGLILEFLQCVLRSPRSLRYSGFRTRLKVSDRHNSWGWKDPRNTYTAEFWKEIYPSAKFILVEREGLDVAASLVKRRDNHLESAVSKSKFAKYFYLLRYRQQPFGTTGLIRSIDDGVALWHSYLLAGREFVKNNKSSSLVIKYEQFLKNPEKDLHRLRNFLNIEPHINDELSDRKMMAKLDPTRANANEVSLHSISNKSNKMLLDYDF